jgi:O-antigen/teichoic acid export membrane protein
MQTNTARIAKNTLMLYFRQMLIMLVSLYTVRVVLNTLGAEDYGIYNVVAGVTGMFSFLSGSISGATQRFFSFELGRGEHGQYKNVFCTCVNIYLLIALISVIFLETIGIWILNTKLVIPYERMDAARFLFHFAVFSFVMNILTTVYTASVISHERMGIFAALSIIDIIVKLINVFILQFFLLDKLKLYAVLLFFASCLHFVLYMLICRKLFSVCRFKFFFNTELFKEIIVYTSWNTIGVLAEMIKHSGINILLNMFFGPLINAARGIAFQVSNSIKTLSNNSYTSIRPRVTKLYAEGKYKEMFSLFFFGTRSIYYLMISLTIPIFIETPFILGIWLKTVPDYTVLFVRLILIDLLIDCLRYPLQTIVYATGNVRNYHLMVSGTSLLLLPISYFFLKIGFPPQIPMIIAIFISMILNFIRLRMATILFRFPLREYCINIAKCILLSILMIFPPGILWCILMDGKFRFFAVCCTSIVSCIVVIYSLGLQKNERIKINTMIKTWRKKKGLAFD